MREAIRLRHYSIRTEQAYTDWIKRYILFHHKRHPCEMGAAEVERFLTHFAVEGRVAASTQNQALSALLFLYKEVLKVDLPWLSDVKRAKKPQRLPVEEVKRVLARMDGQHGLMADLLYGAGLRLLECVRLGEGCGFCDAPDHGEGRQRREGSGDNAARSLCGRIWTR